MIVAMSRVLIVGPKIISAEVIRSLHKMGRLHISPVKTQGTLHPAVLDSGEAEVKHSLERLQQELDGLLTVLGWRGRPARAARPPDWDNLLADLLMQRAEVNQLVKQKLDLTDELALIENYRAAFEALSPLMSRLEPSRRIKAFGFMAKVSESAALDVLQKELRKLTEGRVEFYRHQVDEKKVAVLAAFHIDDQEKIKGFFSKAGVNELKLPSTVASLNMAEAVSQLKEKSRRLPEMIAESGRRIADISNKEGPLLEAYRLMVRDELARLQAKEELPEGRFTFYLQGYLPAEDLPGLKELLSKKFGGQVSVREIAIGPHDGGKTPVMLKNNPLVKPFELLLAIFNPPQYGSIDPTPFVAIFFPIYFGFIIGDVGYGAVLGAVSLFLFFKFKAKEIFRSLAIIFILCSFWAAVFGVIYGELFGEVGEHLHIIAPLTENLNRMKKESVFLLLGVSLAFGLIQVFTGLIIALINGIRQRDRHHILEPAAFMTGLLSIFGAVACFAGLLPKALLMPAIALFAASAGTMAYLVGVAGPIEIFGAVGNILSYARLFAIGLSAVYLAFAANKLGSLIGASGELWAVILGSVLAALVFHPLFFGIGLISPIVQPARLQFVEFFTKLKYYDNPGKPYKPFKTIGGK